MVALNVDNLVALSSQFITLVAQAICELTTVKITYTAFVTWITTGKILIVLLFYHAVCGFLTEERARPESLPPGIDLAIVRPVLSLISHSVSFPGLTALFGTKLVLGYLTFQGSGTLPTDDCIFGNEFCTSFSNALNSTIAALHSQSSALVYPSSSRTFSVHSKPQNVVVIPGCLPGSGIEGDPTCELAFEFGTEQKQFLCKYVLSGI